MIEKMKNLKHIPMFKLGNSNIKHNGEIKYLSVLYDRNYTWPTHVYYDKHKTYKMLHKIKHISKPIWSLESEIIKEIYLPVIEKITCMSYLVL